MKTDTNDIRSKSLEWWTNLPFSKMLEFRAKYYPHKNLLNADERLKIYLSEHPQEQDNTVSEDDLLEGEEFKTIGIIKELRAENKRLSASNKELVEALEGVIKVADRKTIEFDKAKAAIQNNTPKP